MKNWFKLFLALALLISMISCEKEAPPPKTGPESKPSDIQVMKEEVEAAPAVMSKEMLAAGSAMRKAAPPAPQPMAHGGTTPPNAAAYDAMFFKEHGVNPFVDADDDRFSTFAVDVDTASYSVARKYLFDGHLPPSEAVRVEEFVNSFDYDYEPPQGETPFAIHIEGGPSPFGGDKLDLLRVGVKGKVIDPDDRKDAVLTFVIDVSGSMDRENRLGLVKKALRMLLDNLRPADRIGIVVYGTNARVVMPHKGLDHKDEIVSAIESLVAEGSTNAEEGIREGYKLAAGSLEKGKINRVILCSDGVANVGRTGPDEILEEIQGYAARGIFLTAVGFGMGNYNDVLMERLGDKGNGHYAYVDTPAEARKVFVENLTGTLQVVAKDVKIQVEFDPKTVRSYRLIGYENRDVADEKFRDDKEDGGEIGAGHSVTALYEIKRWADEQGVKKAGPLCTVRIRYKKPDGEKGIEVEKSFSSDELKPSFEALSPATRLAAATAEFAEILRKSYWAKDGDLGAVLKTVQGLQSQKPDLIELADLVSKARELKEAEGSK